MTKRFAILFLLAACGGNDTPKPMPDLATPPDLAQPLTPVMNGCKEADYLDETMGQADDRMIMITSAGTFDYPCMTILAGQGVEFMWRFSNYPLAPGLSPSHGNDPAGTTPSPIAAHSSGTLYTVKFPDKGFFPFYVTGHDTDLLGVVQVR